MQATSAARPATGFHLYQGVLIAFAAALLIGGLLCDIAYARSYQSQWVNFAAWLIAGATLFTGLALAWSLVDVVLGPARRGRRLIGLLLLLGVFMLALINSFTHAQDAWGSMPAGLIQSVFLVVASVIATWISISTPRTGTTT